MNCCPRCESFGNIDPPGFGRFPDHGKKAIGPSSAKESLGSVRVDKLEVPQFPACVLHRDHEGIAHLPSMIREDHLFSEVGIARVSRFRSLPETDGLLLDLCLLRGGSGLFFFLGGRCEVFPGQSNSFPDLIEGASSETVSQKSARVCYGDGKTWIPVVVGRTSSNPPGSGPKNTGQVQETFSPSALPRETSFFDGGHRPAPSADFLGRPGPHLGALGARGAACSLGKKIKSIKSSRRTYLSPISSVLITRPNVPSRSLRQKRENDNPQHSADSFKWIL